MSRVMRHGSRWAAAGLAIGLLVGLAAATLTRVESAAVLVVLAGGLGVCVGYLTLVFRRAIQLAGILPLAGQAAATAAWALVLVPAAYWFGWVDCFVPYLAGAATMLALCGALNAALDTLTAESIASSQSNHRQGA